MHDQTANQTTNLVGKSPLRKLGRGLGALLGGPVAVVIPVADSKKTIVEHSPVPLNAASRNDVVSTAELSLGVPRGTIVSATLVEAKPQATPPVGAVDSNGGDLRLIPVAAIHPNRRQPRVDFDEANLKSLAESIRSAGLMQPIVVRPSSGGTFELVAGERRWRASKLLGMETIPAIIRSLSDQSAAELALIENVHREDLNAMERAFALRRLADEFSLTHSAVADRVGLDRVSVTNLLRLTELDVAVATMVRNGTLTQGHAKALLSVSKIEVRLDLAKQAVGAGWSVRELERRVKLRLSIVGVAASETQVPAKFAHVSDLERQISSQLGTKVRLQLGRKKGSGRLIVDFFTLDQFDGLLGKLGVSQLET